MRSTECSFCQHANPPGAKFCNACGAPLYLLPCPQCGAVNDSTATVCHQCAGKLQQPGSRAAPSLPGPRRVAAGGATAAVGGVPDLAPPGSSIDALAGDARVAATLQHLRQLLDQSDPEAPADAKTGAAPDPPVPLRDRNAAAPRSDEPPQYPVSAVGQPRWVGAEARPERRARRRLFIGAALLGCLVAGYFFYLGIAPLAPADTPDRAETGAGSGVATGTVLSPPDVPAGGSPTKSTPAPALTPTRAASTPSNDVPVVRPGTARPGDRSAPETTPSAGPLRADPGQRRGGDDAKDSPPKAAAVVPAPAARPRPTDPGFELQQPRVGPCTEALAALGLCTREPAQRRDQ